MIVSELTEGDNGDFFDDEVRVWSKRKHRILEQYMDAWTKKRGSTHRKLFYVDGFAGRGVYGKAEPLEPGSPVMIARLAERIQEENRRFRLYCINSEIDSNRCQRLREALAFADSELVNTYCGAFESYLDQMLLEIGRAPALFFLDPCGIIGISPDKLAPIARRPDTEMLITLSLPTLFRMSGSGSSVAPEAQGKVARLSEVLGENPTNPNPEWWEKRQTLETDQWADWVVNRYLQNIQRLSPFLKYGLAYAVREKQHSGTKYFLIFATRSMEAFPLMSDFICTQEDEMALDAEMENRAQGQLSFLAPRYEVTREEQMPAVIEEIYEYGLQNQGCSRKQIIEQFAFRHLGEFKQKHIRYMVAQLCEDGRATIYDGPDKHSEKDRRPIHFA